MPQLSTETKLFLGAGIGTAASMVALKRAGLSQKEHNHWSIGVGGAGVAAAVIAGMASDGAKGGALQLAERSFSTGGGVALGALGAFLAVKLMNDLADPD